MRCANDPFRQYVFSSFAMRRSLPIDKRAALCYHTDEMITNGAALAFACGERKARKGCMYDGDTAALVRIAFDEAVRELYRA